MLCFYPKSDLTANICKFVQLALCVHSDHPFVIVVQLVDSVQTRIFILLLDTKANIYQESGRHPAHSSSFQTYREMF